MTLFWAKTVLAQIADSAKKVHTTPKGWGRILKNFSTVTGGTPLPPAPIYFWFFRIAMRRHANQRLQVERFWSGFRPLRQWKSSSTLGRKDGVLAVTIVTNYALETPFSTISQYNGCR